jgi:hypothetical protein
MYENIKRFYKEERKRREKRKEERKQRRDLKYTDRY